MNSLTLENKVVLLTGGARGLGEALARKFAQEKSVVYVGDVREVEAAKVVHELNEQGARAKFLPLDVRREMSINESVAEILHREGRLDVVINNAGVDKTAPVDDITPQEYEQILAVNLRGPILLARRAYIEMKKSGGGQIVNITSTAAKRAWPNASAYHATKWGLLGFSHALHAEARIHNVRVTAVVCGGMQTPFLLERFPDINRETLQDPRNVAETICRILTLPAGTVIPEIMILPMKETSWP